MEAEFQRLLAEIKKLQAEGKISIYPTREERISWAYGNVKLSNPNVTREMVERAADALDRETA